MTGKSFGKLGTEQEALEFRNYAKSAYTVSFFVNERKTERYLEFSFLKKKMTHKKISFHFVLI